MPLARESALADSSSRNADAIPARHTALILTFLTLGGAALRLWHLGAKSLWLDEGATVALARTSWRHFAWVWWHGEASLQTIYFLLMRAWVHGGLSEAWLRLPSALFGIASIPLLYIVARKLMAEPAALAAAALLAVSPAHVYYSQEARGYALAILLVLSSAYFFIDAVEDGRSRDWMLWTIFGIAAFYTHYFAALVLVAQAFSLLFLRPRPWRSFLPCAAIIFVAALPGLSYVFRAAPENLHFVWMPRATPTQVWHLAMFFGGSGVKVAVAIVLWIAGIVAVFRSHHAREINERWHGPLVLLWGMAPPLVLALISLREPMFLQRYMVFSLPAATLLAAMGADVLRKWKSGLVLVVALCAMSMVAVVKQSRKPREDWRNAANAVLASASPGDAVAFVPFYTRTMLDYYRDRYGPAAPPLHVFAPGFYSGGEDARALLAALSANPHQFRHVWLFVSNHDATAYVAERSVMLKEKLQLLFGAPAVQTFTDVEVLRFGS